MTRPINTGAIEWGTGRPWTWWLRFFDSIEAHALSQSEIAERVMDTGDATGWWAQTVALAYEQHIGRRGPETFGEGSLEVSATRTVAGPMEAALGRWLALFEERGDFSGVAIIRGPDIARTNKWRWWRCGLADGSRINLAISDRPEGKAGLGLSHEKLQTPEAVEHWSAFWNAVLARL